MKFQIISDLHLKDGDDYFLPIEAEYLILAGDITHPFQGIFWDFIRYISNNYKMVIYIPGNHEFHGYSLDVVEKFLIESFRIYKNIHYLNGNWLTIRDNKASWKKINIFGGILLSKIPKGMEGYSGITKNVKNFTVRERNAYFKATCSRIKTWLSSVEDDGKNEMGDKNMDNIVNVIVTHYAPIKDDSCHSKHVNDPKNCDYGTDLHLFMDIKNVDYFIYGHTHYNHSGNILKTSHGTYISNQRGGNAVSVGNYNPKFVLEI